MKKVVLSLSKKTVPGKILFGQGVVVLMTGNAFFPTPSPDLITVTSVIDKLQEAENNAAGAGKVPSRAHARDRLVR